MTATHWKDPGSRRSTPRPIGWKAMRRDTLDRDGHQCTWLVGHPDGLLKDRGGVRISPPGSSTPPGVVLNHPHRCPAPATDVDHITHPDHHGDLRSLCSPHHAHRTGGQAAQARWTRDKAKREQAKPKHPGLR